MIPAIIIIVLLHALIDALQIRKGRHIYHGWETLAYFAVCAVLVFWYDWEWISLFSVTTRAAFFDPLLNLFRGKHFAYNGPRLKSKSIVDWVENWTRIPPVYLKIFYILIYIACILILKLKN